MKNVAKQSKILLFTFPPYEPLAEKNLLGSLCRPGSFSITHFPNKEIQLSLHTSVAGCSCCVVGSLAPTEKQLFAYLALCHTLKKDGAQRVTAFPPYLSYSRQEKEESQKSQIAALVGSLLQASGVDDVITVDIHNNHIAKLFPIPLSSFSPASLFAQELKRLPWTSYTLVAPDLGAVDRCRDVAHILGKTKEVVWLSKERHARGVTHGELHGKVQERAVIIDDILDTGQTLVSCCAILRQHGAREVIVMVTHGLFTKAAWQHLWKLGVTRVYCTDTVPLDPKIQRDLRIIVLPMLAQLIKGGMLWK
jgi:ribose-phosphate pyrophosphokinase